MKLNSKYQLILSTAIILVTLFIPLINVHAASSDLITIDGKFNDWKNVKKQRITAPNQPDDINHSVREVAMITDANYVYIYIDTQKDRYDKNMYDEGFSQVYYGNYHLKIGDKEIAFHMPAYNREMNNTLTDKQVLTSDVYLNEWWASNQDQMIGQAAARHYKKNIAVDNILELRLSKVAIEKNGIKFPQHSKLVFYNPNFLGGAVTISDSGAPTGPWILAGIGMMIALFGLKRYQDNNKGQERVK